MNALRARLLAAALLLPQAAAAEPRRPPNVVIISICSLRADHLGCYGYPLPTSPNIDRFARSAVRFERAFVTSSWTNPATMSLFTSLFPRQHGLQVYHERLREGVETMAQAFRSGGYQTAAWPLNPMVDGPSGFALGFSTYVALKDWNDVGPVLRWLDGAEPPFLLYAHLFAAHFNRGENGAPYAPPRRFQEMFLKGRVPPDLPVNEPERLADGSWCDTARPATEQEKEAVRLLYDAGVRAVDEQAGLILDRLRANGFEDDTVVVLCSDHGEGLLDHGLLQHLGSHHDEVLRAALLIRFPDGRGAGREVRQQVRSIDVLPTLLEVTGTPPSAGLARQMRGESLLPLLKRRGRGRDSCAETRHKPMFMSSIRRADGWKLIFDHTTGNRFVYDTRRDPSEARNLYPERGEEAAELEAALWACLGEDAPGP